MPRPRGSDGSIGADLRPLRRRARELRRELATGEFFLKGSLVERSLPCGTEGCACHRDPRARHGPYNQWTRKVRGKTEAVWVPREIAALCREWMREGERVGATEGRLEDLSAEALKWVARRSRQQRKAKA
ncbi:MAG: DUF6788 family protein [Thermoplasmata archaeon]